MNTKKRLRVTTSRAFAVASEDSPWRIERGPDGGYRVWNQGFEVADVTDRWMAEAIVARAKRDAP